MAMSSRALNSEYLGSSDYELRLSQKTSSPKQIVTKHHHTNPSPYTQRKEGREAAEHVKNSLNYR